MALAFFQTDLWATPDEEGTRLGKKESGPTGD
jgi:hypothetical protein